MAAKDVDELCRALVRMQLVPQSQIDACLDELGRKTCTTSSVLHWLEQQGNLTSYQVSKIEKGELAGLVVGGYKLVYRNASGSFARIFRACSLRDGKMVGLKLLRQRWANDPRSVQEFHREAELGRSLQHENIVPIYEVGQEGEQHYFTMEFVEGGNLRDLIKIRGQLSPQEATKCLLEMTEGLHYAATRGAMHRDLKMTNVLMSSQGVARLVDFGLSGAPLDGQGEDDDGVQRAVDYITLEKGTGAPRDDPRTDLFFLGTIYYELLTGVAPLEPTKDRSERGRFSRYQQIRPVRAVAPGLPRAVVAVVERLMQLNPNLRYQHTGEVLRDLRDAMAELGSDTALATRAVTADTPARPPPAPPACTLMCIEHRQKQQDLLRSYFTKHGFRVLMLGDLERGLNRLQTAPPDCLLIMAESVGEAAIEGLRKAQRIATPSPVALLLVLGDDQAEWKDRVPLASHSRVLVQPVTLRELRNVIKGVLGRDDGDTADEEKNGNA